MGSASGSSRHFRPLGRVRVTPPDQRQGAASRPSGSPLLPVISFGKDCGSILRQRHCSGVPSQSGRHQVSLLNSITQGFLRLSESLAIRLAPQLILGSNNILADALSCPHQLPHSEWSLNMTVFQSLSRHWPVQIDLFAASANHRCSNYFSPYRDPQSAGTDAFLQSWDGLQAYAFPPFFIIPRVLAKL